MRALGSREAKLQEIVGTHKPYGHGLALYLMCFFCDNEDGLLSRPAASGNGTLMTSQARWLSSV
jgi:hypothetical protein